MKHLKLITLLVIGLFAVPVFAAQDCDLRIAGSGLTKAQAQELRVLCEQMVLETVKSPNAALGAVTNDLSDPEKLSAWGTVAQEWAKALGIAAKELGIAVDEFLSTDAGKLTAAVIIWQVMGQTLLGFIVGIPLLAVVIYLGIRTARRAKIKSITYGTEKNWRGQREIEAIQYFDEDQTVMYWLAYILTIILSIWIVAGVIF